MQALVAGVTDSLSNTFNSTTSAVLATSPVQTVILGGAIVSSLLILQCFSSIAFYGLVGYGYPMVQTYLSLEAMKKSGATSATIEDVTRWAKYWSIMGVFIWLDLGLLSKLSLSPFPERVINVVLALLKIYLYYPGAVRAAWMFDNLFAPCAKLVVPPLVRIVQKINLTIVGLIGKLTSDA